MALLFFFSEATYKKGAEDGSLAMELGISLCVFSLTFFLFIPNEGRTQKLGGTMVYTPKRNMEGMSGVRLLGQGGDLYSFFEYLVI